MIHSYASVLFYFTLIPIVALGFTLRKKLQRSHWVSLVVLLCVVYVATSPWDNIAVARGYWSFNHNHVWGIWLGYLPLEEYLFFGLQTILAALLLFYFLQPKQPKGRDS